MSEINIHRIEKKLRKRMQRVRSWQEKEREEARIRGSSAGFGLHFDEDSVDNGTGAGTSMPSHIASSSKKKSKMGFSSISMEDGEGEGGLSSPGGSSTTHSKPSPKQRDRRNKILENSGTKVYDNNDGDNVFDSDSDADDTHKYNKDNNNEMMKTMADVIDAIKLNMSSSRRSITGQSDMTANDYSGNSIFLNVQSTVHYNTEKVSKHIIVKNYGFLL